MSYEGEVCRKHEDVLSHLSKSVDELISNVRIIKTTQSHIKLQLESATNRVGVLEDQIVDQKIWKSFLLGGFAVISLLIIPVFHAWISSFFK